MLSHQQMLSQIASNSAHQTNVTNAVMWYVQFDCMSIERIAKEFLVSENTITNWFCEAIEKNYIRNMHLCKQLIRKHIFEYEAKHHLKNSSLRQLYKTALETSNIDISVVA